MYKICVGVSVNLWFKIWFINTWSVYCVLFLSRRKVVMCLTQYFCHPPCWVRLSPRFKTCYTLGKNSLSYVVIWRHYLWQLLLLLLLLNYSGWTSHCYGLETIMMPVDRNLIVMERVMMALQKHHPSIQILPHTLLTGWKLILSKVCGTIWSDTSLIWWSAETGWGHGSEVICVIIQLALFFPSHHKTLKYKLSLLMFSPLSQCIWKWWW